MIIITPDNKIFNKNSHLYAMWHAYNTLFDYSYNLYIKHVFYQIELEDTEWFIQEDCNDIKFDNLILNMGE